MHCQLQTSTDTNGILDITSRSITYRYKVEVHVKLAMCRVPTVQLGGVDGAVGTPSWHMLACVGSNPALPKGFANAKVQGFSPS